MQSLSNTAARHRKGNLLKRIVSILGVALLFGLVVNGVSRVTAKSANEAGFLAGVCHGALMPCALPNLIVGDDVTIYAPNNNGRLYKLGYTLGVNGCGALFFGSVFWRVNRWRKKGKADRETMSSVA